ncbi:hypothetical protein DUNSADRAFT_11244 [Dunaliella salina]|uniref:Uncharacterized protein n=1 Tax=Dunaliella salina TaxID=3046 RepID=A0ABQ7GDT2_DUNSA|nr:hypothetical protein DUNSADRAFT_11244 [Dunaliella salina]|eukprot:KAF5832757.1 hypothetical protein DUNSADRAFT_11244 [Dunaliella salina]
MALHFQRQVLGGSHRSGVKAAAAAQRRSPMHAFLPSLRYFGTLPPYRDCTVVEWLAPKLEYSRLHMRQLRQPLPPVEAYLRKGGVPVDAGKKKREDAPSHAAHSSIEAVQGEVADLNAEQAQLEETPEQAQPEEVPKQAQPEEAPKQAHPEEAPEHRPPPLVMQPSGPQFDVQEHLDTVFPVGFQEVGSVAEIVAIIKRAQNPTPEECVHMLCRMAQLVARHCKQYKRLEVQESRETRTAMEKLDELFLKVPMGPPPVLPDGTRTFRKPTAPSRLSQLGPYPLLQLSNGLLDMVLARRPKVHKVAFAIVAHVRLAEVFQSLPEEQRWPCWSKLMFNLSDTPDTNCKVTPYLQQLFEQGMAHLEPLMTSPDLCPANSLSSFLLAAAKNKLNFKDVHKEFILSVEAAIREGRVMGDASAQDWVDLQWACMQLGHPSDLMAERAVDTLLHAPADKVTGREVADLFVGLMAAQWYEEGAVRNLANLAAHKVDVGDGNAQVCGDVMWSLSALGWYDFDVYDRIIAHMAKFQSKDPRANARVFYAAALAQHVTPALDEFAAAISGQKRLNGWAPHEQADFIHGWAMLRATGQAEDARGMLQLFRGLLSSVFWHKTPSHYRKPDHVRLHEARQVICSAAFGAPGFPIHSKILMRSQEAAEMVARERKERSRPSPMRQKVEGAVAEALKDGGAQVLQNVVVGGFINVGVLMGNQAVKRGIAVDILDEVRMSAIACTACVVEWALGFAANGLLWTWLDKMGRQARAAKGFWMRQGGTQAEEMFRP